MPALLKPRAIIFDWDNTLVSTWPVIHKALSATLNDHNLPQWSLEDVKNKVGKSMRDSFPDLFGDKWEDAGRTYRKYYRSFHHQELLFLDGAMELISYIKEQNIFQALISNKNGNTLREEVQFLGISTYFNSVLGSEDCPNDKPHTDPVYYTFEGSNIDPKRDNVWFVGDTEVDMVCALSSNCIPIFIGNGRIASDYQVKIQNGEIIKIDTHLELLDILRNLFVDSF